MVDWERERGRHMGTRVLKWTRVELIPPFLLSQKNSSLSPHAFGAGDGTRAFLPLSYPQPFVKIF